MGQTSTAEIARFFTSQGAAKGDRQKEFDHFSFVFGTLLVTFWSLFLKLLALFSSRFLPNSFCRTPLKVCGRVNFTGCKQIASR